MKIRRRSAVEEVLADVVDRVEQTAEDLGGASPAKRGTPLLARLVLGLAKLLVNLVRGALAAVLSAVGGLVGGVGGLVGGVTSGVRTTLQGAARTISPRPRKPVAEAVEDAVATGRKQVRKARKKAAKG